MNSFVAAALLLLPAIAFAEEPKPVAKPSAAAKPQAVGDAKDPKKEPVKKPAEKPAKKPESKPEAPKPEMPLTPGGKYRAHDMKRPRPPVVAPPTESSADKPGAAPSDAIVLFDGKSLAAWLTEGRDLKTNKPLTTPAAWPVRDGYMEVPPRSAGSRGSIVTREAFGACQLHIEWATPAEVKGNSQGRGNSGVMLHGFCEVQVLDSYENDTYPDGQAASIYSEYPPLVNASRKPGQWQTYDIILEPAKFGPDVKDPKKKVVTRPARITVLHNGLIVQHSEELQSKATKFTLSLQDHNNPVRYRNIWLRPLKDRE